jgi:hypothetical protein
MTVEISEDVAMILRIPVPARSPDDPVKFVDLSSCPGFFEPPERGRDRDVHELPVGRTYRPLGGRCARDR